MAAPTVYALFGIEEGRALLSTNLLPALDGQELTDRGALVFEGVHNRQVAVRHGPWKLIWNVAGRASKRLPSHSLLYHLDQDPSESTNLFEQRPDVVAELMPFLEPWIELGVVTFGERASSTVLKGLAELGYAAD